ncbi:imidazole glycerol phosphate synthase subunit HisF [Helicobacter sp. 12S02232-10]|uniref:imidazole glycerol phosphate synthase subunit HisF n=1 Tax=Helicobacter sp. 12S02232-10 TaxID=1476197 RepID=UPI000BA6A991|nr:imidazole glycerol phosphate synthase subunit HisF [Helicobacter sp. 12S02232-10]PAF49474.1 imidazole glycerol phosphate synthase subunit HisF [Helicobacter sp. 12S02232-10]
MTPFAKRIIPCLDIHNEKVVKGINFVGLKDMGDPAAMAKKYNDAGADELVLLDISATHQNRNPMINTIKSVAKVTFIPLTVGGGIKNLQDIYYLLEAGADKISLNSAAIRNPKLITESATRFGTQCVVIAIDVKKHLTLPDKWEVYIQGGRENTGKDLCEWVKECYERGAGEILLTSMDTDGTKTGYDLKALESIRKLVNIPIIASGGAGKKEHILEVFRNNIADGALAASIFHFDEIKIDELKNYLNQNKISVRI